MKSLGSFLKFARKKSELTQEQIADRLNIVTPVLSKWENDKAVPTLDMLCKLCNILNISIEECITEQFSDEERVLPPENYQPEKLGETLKNLRLKNGWSQAEVGKKLFVTSQTVSKWEAGGVSSLEQLGKLAELFGLTPTELINGLERLHTTPAQTTAEQLKKPDRFFVKITAVILALIIFFGAVTGLIVGLVFKSKNSEDFAEKPSQDITDSSHTDGNQTDEESEPSFICPLKEYNGYQTYSYDPIDGNYYFCLTFTAGVGMEVYAVEDGIVESMDVSSNATRVYIKHANGFVSGYFYVDVPLLQIGDEVKKGQAIAKVSTNYSLFESALLHFEMKLNGENVDPLQYINL